MVARLTIGARRAADRLVGRRILGICASPIPSLDCVIRRLEFIPGRGDGRGVEATVLLPIVFRLD